MVLQDLELGFGKGAAGWLAGWGEASSVPSLPWCVCVRVRH